MFQKSAIKGVCFKWVVYLKMLILASFTHPHLDFACLLALLGLGLGLGIGLGLWLGLAWLTRAPQHWLSTAPGVFFHCCVCAIGWVKCRAQILSMAHLTWPHVA